MKKLSNPRDLLVAQLSELLWVERRLAFDVLPSVIDSASDEQLEALFTEHLGETREHVEHVEQAFRALDMEPSSAFSPGFAGLIEQHDTVASKIVEPGLADRWHAAAGIAAEHFELALYAAIEPLAERNLRDLLQPSAKQENRSLEKLERYTRR